MARPVVKMRRPSKDVLWMHVDRLDRKDGEVWAIQYWRKGMPYYVTTKNVVLQAPCYTQFFGAKERQPKAVIVVPGGRVELRGDVAVITGEQP